MSNTASLAIAFAEAKARLDAADAEVKALRKEILATGLEFLNAEHLFVEVSLSERSSIDTKAVKELLTADQIASVTKTSVIETLRVKPRLN